MSISKYKFLISLFILLLSVSLFTNAQNYQIDTTRINPNFINNLLPVPDTWLPIKGKVRTIHELRFDSVFVNGVFDKIKKYQDVLHYFDVNKREIKSASNGKIDEYGHIITKGKYSENVIHLINGKKSSSTLTIKDIKGNIVSQVNSGSNNEKFQKYEYVYDNSGRCIAAIMSRFPVKEDNHFYVQKYNLRFNSLGFLEEKIYAYERDGLIIDYRKTTVIYKNAIVSEIIVSDKNNKIVVKLQCITDENNKIIKKVYEDLISESKTIQVMNIYGLVNTEIKYYASRDTITTQFKYNSRDQIICKESKYSDGEKEVCNYLYDADGNEILNETIFYYKKPRLSLRGARSLNGEPITHIRKKIQSEYDTNGNKIKTIISEHVNDEVTSIELKVESRIFTYW